MSDTRVSMEPQPFCALPWCGRAFGGEPKRYRVRVEGADGKTRTVVLEYPEGIDFHHVDGQHKGPGVYWCHECHMEHTHVRAIETDYDYDADRFTARRPWVDEPMQPMVYAAEWDH